VNDDRVYALVLLFMVAPSGILAMRWGWPALRDPRRWQRDLDPFYERHPVIALLSLNGGYIRTTTNYWVVRLWGGQALLIGALLSVIAAAELLSGAWKSLVFW
jgi:hypothetical protein